MPSIDDKNNAEVSAVQRLAMNRLEDRLEANAALVQQGLQTVRDDVKELSEDIKVLANKIDIRHEKLDDRVRVLEQHDVSDLTNRVRSLEAKVWVYSGGVAVIGTLAGVILRKFGI